jgi:hypothetical protein
LIETERDVWIVYEGEVVTAAVVPAAIPTGRRGPQLEAHSPT